MCVCLHACVSDCMRVRVQLDLLGMQLNLIIGESNTFSVPVVSPIFVMGARKLELYSTSDLRFFFQNPHILLPVRVQCMATHMSDNAQLRLADEQHPSGGECVRHSQSSNSASLCHFGHVGKTVCFMCK